MINHCFVYVDINLVSNYHMYYYNLFKFGNSCAIIICLMMMTLVSSSKIIGEMSISVFVFVCSYLSF